LKLPEKPFNLSYDYTKKLHGVQEKNIVTAFLWNTGVAWQRHYLRPLAQSAGKLYNGVESVKKS